MIVSLFEVVELPVVVLSKILRGCRRSCALECVVDGLGPVCGGADRCLSVLQWNRSRRWRSVLLEVLLIGSLLEVLRVVGWWSLFNRLERDLRRLSVLLEISGSRQTILLKVIVVIVVVRSRVRPLLEVVVVVVVVHVRVRPLL